MQWKLFISLIFTFIAFTIIGTQTHEWGHYAAAKYFDLNPSLYYQSVDYDGDILIEKEQQEIFKQFEEQIKAKQNFPLKERWAHLFKISERHDFYFTLWGPVQTMLTGSIGFLLLVIFRKQFFKKDSLIKFQWLLVFLSLFWLREVFNTFLAVILFLVKGQTEFYGDEFNLSIHLNLPAFTIPIITAIIGLTICTIVVLKFVSYSQRKTFIAAGFVGGILGFVFWMYFLGPIVLP